MSHHLMQCHLSPLKTILKILENYLMSSHICPLKNNSKNSISIPCDLMPHHLSILKNNYKEFKKITSCHISFPYSQIIPCHLCPLRNNSKN
jgi:hypothetical protein